MHLMFMVSNEELPQCSVMMVIAFALFAFSLLGEEKNIHRFRSEFVALRSCVVLNNRIIALSLVLRKVKLPVSAIQ
jgi:hypothetical protein